MTDDPHARLEQKIDRVLLCLEGEPLAGRPGLVARVGSAEVQIAGVKTHLRNRSKLQSKLARAAGVGFVGAAGAWLWSMVSGHQG